MNRAPAAPGKRRPHRRRRGFGSVSLLAGIGAVALLAALVMRTVAARPGCAGPPVVASVAVSPQIAPAIARLSGLFNRQHREIGGHCAVVVVTAEPSASVAAVLAGARADTAGQLAAWIPSTSLWVQVARATPAGARLVHPTPIGAARTRLVLAMPRWAAARVPAFGSSVGWRFLLPRRFGGPHAALGLQVLFPGPDRTGTGLAALLALQPMLGQGPRAGPRLARFALRTAITGSAGVLAALADPPPAPAGGNGPPSYPVTITTEQVVYQFDQSHPRQPLAVRYPAGGDWQLSFPYVLIAPGRPAALTAAQFGQLLRSRYAASYLGYEGFRTGDAAMHWPAADGLAAADPPAVQPPPGQAVQALRAWRRLVPGGSP